MTQGYEGNKQEDVTEMRDGKKPTSNCRAAPRVAHCHLPSRRNLIRKLQALKIQPCFLSHMKLLPSQRFHKWNPRDRGCNCVRSSWCSEVLTALPPIFTATIINYQTTLAPQCLCSLHQSHNTDRAVSSLRAHNTLYFNENLFPPPSWLDISNSTFFHLSPAPTHLVASQGFFFNKEMGIEGRG